MKKREFPTYYRQADRHDPLMLIQTGLLAFCSESTGMLHPAMRSTMARVSFVSIRSVGNTIGEVPGLMLFVRVSAVTTTQPHEIRNDLRTSISRLPVLVTANQRFAKR